MYKIKGYGVRPTRNKVEKWEPYKSKSLTELHKGKPDHLKTIGIYETHKGDLMTVYHSDKRIVVFVKERI